MKIRWMLILAGAVLLVLGVSVKQSKSGKAAENRERPAEAVKARTDGNDASAGGKTEAKNIRCELQAIVYANIEASRQEDLETYMYTLYPDAPHYEATRELMEKTFADYDLEYELTDVSVSAVAGNTARVSFTQSTRKVAGPEFKTNRVTGVHLLRKHGQTWKIFSTRINDIKKEKAK